MIRLEPEEYTVGWICSLYAELAVAECMLDETHEPPLHRHTSDDNQYVLGKMGPHNVVIACLPSGGLGAVSAANVAYQMLSTFSSISRSGFGLMVGTGGGAPSLEYDIRLGDVAVSEPKGRFGGVIQYDFGKMEKGGNFRITGCLNQPPIRLLNAIARLKAKHEWKDHDISKYLSHMFKENPSMQKDYAFHDHLIDQLFDCEYEHHGTDSTCVECDVSQSVARPPRAQKEPVIHYGLIASGSQVMKCGKTRNRLSKEENVICFEMEAAGLMDTFPCLVIRGISNYADSHKNDSWRDYAAAVAAAYTKELLCMIAPVRVALTRPTFPKQTPVVSLFGGPEYIQRNDVADIIDEKFLAGDFVLAEKGNGKPQKAIENVHKYIEDHSDARVLWVQARDMVKLVESYKSRAGSHSSPEAKDSKNSKLIIESKELLKDGDNGILLVLMGDTDHE